MSALLCYRHLRPDSDRYSSYFPNETGWDKYDHLARLLCDLRYTTCILAELRSKSLPFLAPAVSSLEQGTFSHDSHSYKWELSLYQDGFSLASSAKGERLDAEQKSPRCHPRMALSELIISFTVPTTNIPAAASTRAPPPPPATTEKLIVTLPYIDIHRLASSIHLVPPA